MCSQAHSFYNPVRDLWGSTATSLNRGFWNPHSSPVEGWGWHLSASRRPHLSFFSQGLSQYSLALFKDLPPASSRTLSRPCNVRPCGEGDPLFWLLPLFWDSASVFSSKPCHIFQALVLSLPVPIPPRDKTSCSPHRPTALSGGDFKPLLDDHLLGDDCSSALNTV